jgi:hypothetical protein
MRIPTSITLRKLLVEFRNVGPKIAVGLGTLLRCDNATTHTVEQRFCVALEIGYKFYLEPSHHVKDCLSLESLRRKNSKSMGDDGKRQLSHNNKGYFAQTKGAHASQGELNADKPMSPSTPN